MAAIIAAKQITPKSGGFQQQTFYSHSQVCKLSRAIPLQILGCSS